ncbi:aminopeptidase, partial [sediment metagenome]
MRKAARIALTQCMGVKKGESVLIVTDNLRRPIAEAFLHEAEKLTRKAFLITTPVGKIDGEEPPKHIAKAMKRYDVLLLVTTMSLSHTKATAAARKGGSRIASLPGVTEGMMKRCIPVDYGKMSALNRKVIRLLEKADEVRIITKKGTDLTMSAKGRELFDDNGMYNRGRGLLGNLPAGEVAFAPMEGKTNGVFVVDASMIEERMKEPIKITVKNGYACGISGGPQARKLLGLIRPLGRPAFNIA